MDGFMNSLKASFTSGFLSFSKEFIYNDTVPQTFPVLKVIPLLLRAYEALEFQALGKKRFCIRCVQK